MVSLKPDSEEKSSAVGRRVRPVDLANPRLERDFFAGRYQPGQSVQLSDVATEYQLSGDTVLRAFAEFQSLGMVTLGANFSAVIHSPNPKEMQEAYEIRAGLEEIAGRTAAATLKGNTAHLYRELEAMRAAVRDSNLDAYAEHDVKFHRHILESAQNEVLLRVWDALAFDLRIRAAIDKVTKDLPDVVESHQPILNALEKGRGREAGVLLRNHVETFLEYLKKSQSDSGFHRALRRDLEGAKDVQKAFIPPQNLSIPSLDCETFYRPVHEIGGDYYDFLSLPSRSWGIAIGDVSGKGIGAALIMASLHASLRARALHPHHDLSALIEDVSRLVYESSPTHFFASLFYAEYHPDTRVLNYVNAGHNPPVIVRSRSGACHVFRLDSAGMPVGISEEAQFRSAKFQLEPGDLLAAYTDGITEAENQHGEFWGPERLEVLLQSSTGETPDRIIRRILDELTAFTNGKPQRDDMTLVVMKVKENGAA